MALLLLTILGCQWKRFHSMLMKISGKEKLGEYVLSSLKSVTLGRTEIQAISVDILL